MAAEIDGNYATQFRGDRGAYDRYLNSMDASMKQKIALTAAHLLALGRVADMGMGSGTGSEALAALYPAMEVIGVDISETMVKIASQKFDRANLSFIVGDIAAPCFRDGELDGIFNSSVLHHVTSFNDYDHQMARSALATQVTQLADAGVLIVRDFVAPESLSSNPEDDDVYLDLPDNDGKQLSVDQLNLTPDLIQTCSTAALLRLFATQFRKLSNEPGFEYQELTSTEMPAGLPTLRPGWCRFRLNQRMAVEFVLRKDYRVDWKTEVLEEYTYFTQSDFQKVFADLGLRRLASTPIRNPWIVQNRFVDKFCLFDLQGCQIEWPATNIVVVGEKVGLDQGVCFRSESADPLGFLSMSYYRDKRSGRVFDLVRRPHLTIDVVPWFESQGEIYVLARKGYPRPIIGEAGTGVIVPDGSLPATYLTETLNALQTDQPIGRTVETLLRDRASILESQILEISPGSHYYPSPGGIEEEVTSKLVHVEEVLVQKSLPATSGFSTSGQVRAIEARQALRAAQVSGLPCNRLEINIYELLLSKARNPGQWIGANVEIGEFNGSVEVETVEQLSLTKPRRTFETVESHESRHFLELKCRDFVEINSQGKELARRELEFVQPAKLSPFTLSSALLMRYNNEILFAVDDDDLPAVQGFTGRSNVCVVPAWRLPKQLHEMTPAREWVKKRIEQEYGVTVGRIFELGGYYHPSPGVTPEIVYPHVFEVTEMNNTNTPNQLHWLRVTDLLRNRSKFCDGHLLTALFRTAHALGLIHD